MYDPGVSFLSHTARVEQALGRFGALMAATLGESVFTDFDTVHGRALVALERRDLVLRVAREGRGFRESSRIVLSHSNSSGEDARFLAARPWRLDAVADAFDSLEASLAFEPGSVPIDQAFDDMGPEGKVFRPWAVAFERHYGQPLEAWDLGRETPSVCFPVVAADQNTFLGAEFGRARMRAYILDRGYAVADGLLRVVPPPSALTPAEGGLEARLMEHAPVAVSPGRWVRSVLAGVLPINVLGWPKHHGLVGRLAGLTSHLHPQLRTMWNSHFCALGHDMSLHAFSFHRMGARSWRPIREALWPLLRTASERTVADFIEGPLTRHCAELWGEVSVPEQFDALFDERLPALLSQLPTVPRG